jgi:hypothetical protein
VGSEPEKYKQTNYAGYTNGIGNNLGLIVLLMVSADAKKIIDGQYANYCPKKPADFIA